MLDNGKAKNADAAGALSSHSWISALWLQNNSEMTRLSLMWMEKKKEIKNPTNVHEKQASAMRMHLMHVMERTLFIYLFIYLFFHVSEMKTSLVDRGRRCASLSICIFPVY